MTVTDRKEPIFIIGSEIQRERDRRTERIGKKDTDRRKETHNKHRLRGRKRETAERD